MKEMTFEEYKQEVVKGVKKRLGVEQVCIDTIEISYQEKASIEDAIERASDDTAYCEGIY